MFNFTEISLRRVMGHSRSPQSSVRSINFTQDRSKHQCRGVWCTPVLVLVPCTKLNYRLSSTQQCRKSRRANVNLRLRLSARH